MLFRVILISFLFLLNLPLISDDCSTALNFRDKPLSLKGGWLFLRGDNQGWKDPNLQDAGWGRKSLPDYGKDKNSPIYGFHWYRCHIFFSDNSNIPGGLGVYLGKLRDADEVYFNGTLIGSTGKVTPPQSIDFEKKRIYSIPDRLVVPGKNVLAIRIFSTTKNFGITTSPFIGEEEKLYDKIIKEESFPIVAGFVFILMGIFFIFSSLVKSKNHSNLLFSLFSIFLGVYTLLRSSFRYEIFDNFVSSYSTELFILMLLPVLFLNFFFQYLGIKRKLYTYIYDITQLGLAIYSLISSTLDKWSIVIDANVVLLLVPTAVILYINYKSYRRHRRKIKFILIGTFGLFPCVILDSLTAIELIKLPQTIPFGFLFFLINISIQLSEEMVDNYKNFIKQESDLVKMEKLKTNFIFNISIEFRSYLDRALITAKDLLNNSYEKQELIEKLSQFESVMSLAKSLIHDAIVLNSVETHEYEMFTERFSLKSFISDIINIIETRHSSVKKKYTVNIQDGDIEVTLNKELSFLLFYHLIENIYLYTEDEVDFKIDCEVENSILQIKIQDYGKGIPVEQRNDIFKKFVRGSNALAEQIHGVGIGLTLVQEISKAFGGDATIDSNDSGTTAYVSFPVKK